VARISGRNLWIAIPAGMLCAAVVGALAYLAVPMLTPAASWVGAMAYNITHLPAPAVEEGTAGTFATTEGSDCRALYPDPLWSELVWTPEVLLSQTAAAPAEVDPALAEALQPEVRVSCTWRAPGERSISTTVAEVAADAVPVAAASLTAAGYRCEQSGSLRCVRTSGAVVQEDIMRDGLWISSVETSWHPEDYSGRIAAHVWR